MRYCFTHHELWDAHDRDDSCSDVLDLGGQHDPVELHCPAPMYAMALAAAIRAQAARRVN
jgi:hypothetical protein